MHGPLVAVALRDARKSALLRVTAIERAPANKIHLRNLAAPCARALQIIRPEEEGAGNAGCLLHPRSRVQ
jgi:hypothetical protein